MALHPYPCFSLAERDRRWAAVRSLMRKQEVAAIVVPNNTGHSTDFQANGRYLTHVGGGGDSDIAVVFPLDGEVTAIATSAAERWPTVQDWTPDVREAKRSYGRATAERLKELGVAHARIGVTGLGRDTRSPEGTILLGFWRALKDALPNSTFIDATPILRRVRIIKSGEEIEVLKKSCWIIERGIEAKINNAKVGVTDWEVWAHALSAMMIHGSEIPVHQNWLSGRNPNRTLTRPTFRKLEYGDLIIDELEASWIGYRSQMVQPVFVGKADPVHIELFKVQRELFEALRENFRSGVTLRELGEVTIRAGAKATPKSGPAASAQSRLTLHGRGAGDDGPIMVGNMHDSPDLDLVLEDNMVCIMKPSVEIGEGKGRTICRWGDTVAVSSAGGVRLGTWPHQLAVAQA